MESNLSYRNEDDKCYGATGMAVAMVIFDGEDVLSCVNLDASPDSIVEFTSEFYFSGNQNISAKSAWNIILKNFNLTMAIAIANVMCRKVVLERSSMNAAVKTELRKIMLDAGNENCGLDEDETIRLFDKNYNYLQRVFNHYGVQQVVNEFAETLKRRRKLSRLDVLDLLLTLSSL